MNDGDLSPLAAKKIDSLNNYAGNGLNQYTAAGLAQFTHDANGNWRRASRPPRRRERAAIGQLRQRLGTDAPA